MGGGKRKAYLKKLMAQGLFLFPVLNPFLWKVLQLLHLCLQLLHLALRRSLLVLQQLQALLQPLYQATLLLCLHFARQDIWGGWGPKSHT